MLRYTRIYLLFCFLPLRYLAMGQSIPVTENVLNDYSRSQQLTDSLYPGFSFCVRPMAYTSGSDDSLTHWWFNSIPKKVPGLPGRYVNLLPLTFSQQYNSHHPYGWNDGAMIPVKGYEGLISTGIFAKTGHFTVQLLPELVWAENRDFETFPTEHGDIIWASYYQWQNRADIPERFGTRPYFKIFPGQSSVRYNTASLSYGISTENLWWGPGRHNALVMSDNAPGFLHATINTFKPVHTKIGDFEGQLIGGKLTSSGISLPDTLRVYNGNFLYQPKMEEWRYLTGMVLSWQPKWVKGLFVGFTDVSYLYHSDISGIADILPLAGIIRSNKEKQNKKASLGSVFARYVMPEEKAELYIEYGRNDRSAGIYLLSDKEYPSGYVVGLRKLSNSRRDGSHWEFAAEITQLQLPAASLINQAKSWYTHDYVRQGYTNDGQVMGAGIGPGSNSQMIDISWVKGTNKVGVMLERVVRNNDFYYNIFPTMSDWERHWIDLSTTLHADWKYKKIFISSEMGLIRSLNYEWFIIPYAAFFSGYDFLNFHGKLSVSYRW
jgi:hypothetical protein